MLDGLADFGMGAGWDFPLFLHRCAVERRLRDLIFPVEGVQRRRGEQCFTLAHADELECMSRAGECVSTCGGGRDGRAVRAVKRSFWIDAYGNNLSATTNEGAKLLLVKGQSALFM